MPKDPIHLTEEDTKHIEHTALTLARQIVQSQLFVQLGEIAGQLSSITQRLDTIESKLDDLAVFFVTKEVAIAGLIEQEEQCDPNTCGIPGHTHE